MTKEAVLISPTLADCLSCSLECSLCRNLEYTLEPRTLSVLFSTKLRIQTKQITRLSTISLFFNLAPSCRCHRRERLQFGAPHLRGLISDNRQKNPEIIWGEMRIKIRNGQKKKKKCTRSMGWTGNRRAAGLTFRWSASVHDRPKAGSTCLRLFWE